MSWPGLQINFNRNTQIFNVAVLDHRETETIPINSASGNFNVGAITNIFDNNYHTLICSWAMNDGISFPASIPSSTSSLQKSILIFDNTNIPNNNLLWGGKKTPLNFAYDDFNRSTFLSIGGELQNQQSSSSILNFTDVQKMLNGIIKEIVIWNCVLTGGTILIENSNMLGPWLQYYNGEDPLTGTNLKSLSSNVVAYYKFDEELVTSTTAKDYASTNNGGAQTNPTSGNTIGIFGASYTNIGNTYTITDNSLIIPDNIHFSGNLQFIDENGITRKIGKIFYDLGIMIFDNEYNNGLSGLPLLSTLASTGMSLFSSASTNNFYINSINFTAIENIERLNVNLLATGNMMNITENITGIDETTGKQLLNESAGYVTSVALYNDKNEMMAIAKLNKPVRKDSDHNVNINIKLDF